MFKVSIFSNSNHTNETDSASFEETLNPDVIEELESWVMYMYSNSYVWIVPNLRFQLAELKALKEKGDIEWAAKRTIVVPLDSETEYLAIELMA